MKNFTYNPYKSKTYGITVEQSIQRSTNNINKLIDKNSYVKYKINKMKFQVKQLHTFSILSKTSGYILDTLLLILFLLGKLSVTNLILFGLVSMVLFALSNAAKIKQKELSF